MRERTAADDTAHRSATARGRPGELGVTSSTCPVCGSDRTRPYKRRSVDRALVPDDLRISDSRYGTTLALRRCRACGFLFAEGDEVAELVDLYARVSDPGYEESERARILQMRWLLDRALRLAPRAISLLDVGAASGLLVEEAVRRGLDAVGVEPSLALADRARQRGVEMVHGAFPTPALAERRFDVVCLVDVLEHVADPVALLRGCREALAPDGVVILVTPDVGSVAARILRRRWWHFRLAHVGYFDRRSLVAATSAAGLSWVDEGRARWFLPLGYLAERLLALAGRSPSKRPGVTRRLDGWTIPLDLRDSFVVALKRRA